MCQGQQQSAALGYSPMPINLVEDSFNQIRQIPGAVVQSIRHQRLQQSDLHPDGGQLCWPRRPRTLRPVTSRGPTQCTTGTGGAAAVATPISAGSPAAAAAGSGSSGSSGASGGSTAAGTAGAAAATSIGGGAGGAQSCAAGSAHCAESEASRSALDAKPEPLPATLAVATGWSWDQYLMVLVALLVLAVILIPGWFAAVAAAVTYVPRRVSGRRGARKS
jgi:hypothetical protein